VTRIHDEQAGDAGRNPVGATVMGPPAAPSYLGSHLVPLAAGSVKR
jgi:hypothetical protein